MVNQQSTSPIRAGDTLARFHRFAREMVLTATDHGGTMLDLVAYEPGGSDRPIAVFERDDDGNLEAEWSLGAHALGLQHGSKAREGVTRAVQAAVATIFDGTDLDTELGIQLHTGITTPGDDHV
ncbi:hypothetical protein [Glycomyces salinus]|uniref:hypothetical protein n=1 Tax=Glycomyces salinus TaxID=980294 RepID=UPI0018EAFC67|nr:hypothetical protein [Glycomyces salinus]